MNNITITHELCAEDRARLDRLTAALEHKTCDSCVASALTLAEVMQQKSPTGAPTDADLDEIQQRLSKVVAKASDHAEPPKNATEEAKAETAPNDHQVEEEPTHEEDAPAEVAKPTVTLEQIQKKVTLLAAANGGKKKDAVREIVNTYAKRVSELPEDKWSEVWDKLTALEEV